VRLEPRAQFRQPGLSLLAIARRSLHLDQLMSLQRAVHFRHHGFGKTLVTHDHHGVQRVRGRSQLAALCRRKFFHGGIMPAGLPGVA